MELKIEKYNVILKEDDDYPNILKVIKNPPRKLHIIGNTDILKMPSVAIVGSRDYSEYGRKMTEKFTKELIHNGYAIVSGMARGIDSFAHKTCIDCRWKDNCSYCMWVKLCFK